MNKRTVRLVYVALALGAAYLAFFIDWHKEQKIHISWDKSLQSIMGGSENPTIIFHLDKPQPLTAIEVVESEDARTNKYPHPLWHLVAADAPVPTSTFRYGAKIKGMKPEIATALPEPLEPDISYTLLVEAGKDLKGQLTFQAP
jgi:hypothetical protein